MTPERQGPWTVKIDLNGKITPFTVDPEASDDRTQLILTTIRLFESRVESLQYPSRRAVHGGLKGRRQFGDDLESYNKRRNEYLATISALRGETGGVIRFLRSNKGELIGLEVRDKDIIPGKS